MTYLQKTIQILKQDAWRMECLRAISSITTQDLWIGGGFIRNAIWDHLYQTTTPLNDVDVVYFDTINQTREIELEIERNLVTLLPRVPWEVYNQARMHLAVPNRLPYASLQDAVSYWPETVTCVACKIDGTTIKVIAPWGLEENWSGTISNNPQVAMLEIVKERVNKWQKLWTQLKYND